VRWIGATLVGLLALSYALIALAAPGADVHPAPDDRGLGGLSILAETLSRGGYRVAYDKSSRPRLQPDDVVLTPVMVEHATPEAALRHVRSGGRGVVLGIPTELQPIADSIPTKDAQGKQAKIDNTSAAPAKPGKPDGEVASATGWYYGEDSISFLSQVGKGRIARLEDGALATNRFLGRLDNARVVLSTIATVAKPGDRLVFLAGGYGEDEAPGPVESIGPWAVGALWQTLAVLAAFGIARGIRFGLPVPETTAQRGSRELLDAVATFYRRGKRTDAPLNAAARNNPADYEAQSMARRSGISEAEARTALATFESRSKRRK